MKPNLKKLLSRDQVLSGVLALILYPVLAWFVSDWLTRGIMCGLLAALFVLFRREFLLSLHRRITEPNSVVWTVEVNGVEVGALEDSEYARIRLSLLSNVNCYLAQARNSLHVVWRVIEHVYLAVPLAFFWLVTIVFLVDPGALSDLVRQFEGDKFSMISAMAGFRVHIIRIVVLMVSFSVGLNMALGVSRFGFSNRFQIMLFQEIRRRLGVAAGGDTVLVRWDNYGMPHFPDDWAAVPRQLAARFRR